MYADDLGTFIGNESYYFEEGSVLSILSPRLVGRMAGERWSNAGKSGPPPPMVAIWRLESCLPLLRHPLNHFPRRVLVGETHVPSIMWWSYILDEEGERKGFRERKRAGKRERESLGEGETRSRAREREIEELLSEPFFGEGNG